MSRMKLFKRESKNAKVRNKAMSKGLGVATAALLLTAMATSLTLSNQTQNVYAETVSESAANNQVESSNVDLAALRDSITEKLTTKQLSHNSKLANSQYRRSLTFELNQENTLNENDFMTIVKLLKYHGSREFDLAVYEVEGSTNSVKFNIAFAPDLTERDANGYAIKLNLNTYDDQELNLLTSRYKNVLTANGYEISNYSTEHTLIGSIEFRMNYDNGRIQKEYNQLMDLIDNYSKSNTYDSVSLKVRADEDSKNIIVEVYAVNSETGTENADSELARMIAELRKGYGNQDPVVAENPVSSEPSDPTPGESSDQEVDEEGFIRAGIGESILVDEGKLAEFEKELKEYGNALNTKVFELINKARQDNGLSALNIDENAKQFANEKSLDMLLNGQFSLTDSDNKTPIDYMRAAGFQPTQAHHMIGQCVKMSNAEDTAKHLVQTLLNDDKLRSRLLDSKFTSGFAGVAFQENTIYVTYILTAY